MDRVVDSNLLVTMVVDQAIGQAIRDQLRTWLDAGDDFHAPTLLRYEIANALARLRATDALTEETAREAWDDATMRFPVRLHELANGPRVIDIAQKLRRQNAYDASYVALAEQLGADVWTLDGPLARNAASTSLPVRLLELPQPPAETTD